MKTEKYVKEIEKFVEAAYEAGRNDMRAELEVALKKGLGGIVGTVAVVPEAAPVKAHKPSAARKLQGRYMGLLRAHSGREKQAIKRLCKEKGKEAAVAAMQKGFKMPKPKAKPATATPPTA